MGKRTPPIQQSGTRNPTDPKGIAEYHNVLKEMKINVQELRDDGFGEKAAFECLLAELAPEQEGEQGRPVGYILFFFGYSMTAGRMVNVENLYVHSEFRGRGIGTRLMSEAVKLALAKGCRELKFIAVDWNRVTTDWLQGLGVRDQTQASMWHCFELDEAAMRWLAETQGGGRAASGGALGPDGEWPSQTPP
ncbi:thialysine N-epsilon-acetyltransferase-like isoform X1 [Carettochelys insculpta]|uniref:thialysine N-epsilon-acetyltransferase-like isoform X1 n=1 Tax=Carettochelys insculpta TaxID=44489 RepID=UPI003EB6C82F